MHKASIHKMIAILASVTLMTIGVSLFSLMYTQHKANEHTINECLQNDGAVTISKDNFWSPVVCERK